MITFKEAFGFNLKFFRKLKNMTQEKLGELIDLHTRQLSKIETGAHFPSCKTLEKIFTALEVSPGELFSVEYDAVISDSEDSNQAVSEGNINGEEYKDNMRYFFTKLKRISKDKNCANFVKTAIEALDDSKELDKLENLIAGMKLVRNK